MKRLPVILLMMFFVSVTVTAQSPPEKKKATDADKIAAFDEEGRIARGQPIGDSELVELDDVIANPESFTGRMVRVSGFVVRSCRKEGCWAELGPEKGSEDTVRVTMKDHQFFIPLKSAGYSAVAEGMFEVKKISAEKVKHLVEDDGAQFKRLNKDGSVTEVSLVASGIVLTRD